MKTTMRKRLLSFALAVLMIVGMIPVFGNTEARAAEPVKHTLDPSKLTAGDIIADTPYSEDSYFTLCASSGSKLTVQGSNKTFGGTQYTTRIKTNGVSSNVTDSEGKVTGALRAIKFTTTGAATVSVKAVSGTTGSTRQYAISPIVDGAFVYTDDNVFSVDNTGTNTETITCMATYEITKADTYYIHVPVTTGNNGIAFYEIIVEESSSGSSEPAEKKNGLHEENGKWYYYENDEKVNTTGIVSSGGSKWFVNAGVLATDVNGKIVNEDVAYYFKNGKLMETEGLYNIGTEQSGDKWQYFNNGVFDASYTGIVENGGSKWYVEAGELSSTTGAVTVNETKYCVVNGKISGKSIRQIDSDWCYINENGALDTSYTGLVENGGAEWYIVNGVIDLSFIGTIDGKNVIHGKVHE